MIWEFRRLIRTTESPLELHLAGSVGESRLARDYFLRLCEAAGDLPVFFHPSATAERIKRLCSSATLYWHLTGAW
jgi:hypothetical protein